MDKDNFNKIINGKRIELFTLCNSRGMQVALTNYGATVVSIMVPDQNNNYVDVVLGYDSIDEYILGHGYFGVIAGRYANRIAKGHFTIGDTAYKLNVNNGENHLHGGLVGFNSVVWDAMLDKDNQTLELSYLSKDGEEHYPGNLKVKVTYHLTEENELSIRYHAATDKRTIVNLTNHSYFNLDGFENDTILDHRLKIYSNFFTPINSHQIPTGEYRSVANTPMDFTDFKSIGKEIEQDDEQLKFGFGYDHNWVLNNNGEVTKAAVVFAPMSGRYMEVWTNQPGIQFYSSNFLDGSDIGKNGKAFQRRSAFCLETQHFPDSPNQPHFPSTILNPEEVYDYECIYKFSSKIV